MTTDKLKTIILRFRDLSVADTIQEHKDVIDESGFVWWGWWAKPQEKIPFAEFEYLKSLCSSDNGLRIYLFDSGQKVLYSAKCTDIYYHNGEKCGSPNSEETPSYYSQTEYMAWFKFEEISSAICGGDATKELKKYSYLKVDDFFVSGHSKFTPFYGKRIYSIDELAEQQRTIWFVRDFEKGDKSHEVHSYSATLRNGKNVDSDFKVVPTNDMLWISDLHFSQDHHAFKTEPGNDNRLSIRLNRELYGLNTNISHVIISGDLTYSSQTKEYDMVAKFISDLNSMYDLNETCYSICPGNHDLKLNKNGYSEDDKVEVANDEAKQCYVDFYRKIYGIEPTESLYSIRRILTPELKPVEIISINTCLLQQGEHFMGMGYVGNDQIAEIENELSLTKDKPIIRILVMHHHLLPVMYSEKPAISCMYSMMLDSEAVAQFIIRNNIKVVLHGHTHKEYYAEVVRKTNDSKYKFFIVGTGSTGVIQKELSESRPNMFSTLSFSDKELVIKQFSIHATGETSKILNTHTIPYFDDSVK